MDSSHLVIVCIWIGCFVFGGIPLLVVFLLFRGVCWIQQAVGRVSIWLLASVLSTGSVIAGLLCGLIGLKLLLS